MALTVPAVNLPAPVATHRTLCLGTVGERGCGPGEGMFLPGYVPEVLRIYIYGIYVHIGIYWVWSPPRMTVESEGFCLGFATRDGNNPG